VANHRHGVYPAMAKDEKTSPKAAKSASKVLQSSAGKDSKTAAASALAQAPDKKKS